VGYLKILLFAGLGIIIAIVALPQTRWIVHNNVEYLFGRAPADRYYGLLDPSGWPNQTAADQLARALQTENVIWNNDSGTMQLRALEKYCRSHPNDAAGWAHLARMATKMPLHLPNSPTASVPPDFVKKRERFESLLELATTTGERIEPQNLYFTLLKAALYESKGRHKEAQGTVLAAKDKTDFDDHLQEEGEVVYQAVSKNGYRGAALELHIYAGIILPHLSSLNQLLPFIPKDGHGNSVPALQRALILEAHTSAENATSPITVLVMKGLARRVVAGKTGRYPTKLPKDLDESARTIDRKMGTRDVEAALRDFDNVKAPTIRSFPETLYGEGIAQPIVVSVLVIALIFGIPFVLLARGVSKVKWWLSRNSESVKEHGILWSLWSLLFALAASAIVVGLWKSDSPQTLISFFGNQDADQTAVVGRDLVTTGLLALIVSVIMIPRRPARLSVCLPVTYAVLPVLYFFTIVKALQVDQNTKLLVGGFRNEADQYRGQWRD
jgi:hypothetical protein